MRLQIDRPPILVLLALAALGIGLSACADEGERRCDIVLVSVDTLRVDRLGLYGAQRDTDGSAEEPWSIRWLAENGLTYDNAWAPAGRTIPSLATLWTGVPPLEHGAFSHLTPMQPITFAEKLKESGYRTFAIVSNPSLQASLGFDRGFDFYRIRRGKEEIVMHEPLLERAGRAIENGKKVLIWIHFMTPHMPYEPPPEHNVYSSGGEPEIGDKGTLYGLHLDPETATPEVVEHLRALYDGEIRAANEYVQDFLSRLDRIYEDAGRGGLLQNARIAFFSDHGEELGDRHGYFMHTKSLYSGTIRVPLILLGCGVPSGQRTGELIGLENVMPRLLGEPVPTPDFVIASWHSDFFAIRHQNWTLVQSPCDNYPDGPFGLPARARFPYPRVALYDRRSDPFERVDVSREYPEVTQALLAKVHSWYSSLQKLDVQEVAGEGLDEIEELGYASKFEFLDCEPLTPSQWLVEIDQD